MSQFLVMVTTSGDGYAADVVAECDCGETIHGAIELMQHLRFDRRHR